MSAAPVRGRTSVVSAFSAIPEGGTDAKAARPKILALCGARSNDAVTQMQLKNLHITSDKYDVHYLHGPLPEDEADANLDGLFHGPFYSWLDPSTPASVDESLTNAVRLVLKVCDAYGPFDGVYGFSNGGLVAALAANVASDAKLKSRVCASVGSTTEHMTLKPLPDKAVLQGAMAANVAGQGAAGGRASTLGRMSVARASVVGAGRASVMGGRASTARGSVLGGLFGGGRRASVVASAPVTITGRPFNYVLCACAGLSAGEGLEGLASTVLGGSKNAGDPSKIEDGFAHSVNCPSLHLVGLEDPLKTRGEDIAALFVGGKVLYLPGGHTVSRDTYADDDVRDAVRALVEQKDEDDEFDVDFAAVANFIEINPVTSISVQTNVQVSRARIADAMLPSGRPGGATITGCLAAQPPDAPFLYDARSADGKCLTYGQALDFIRGGDGDLRRLGVRAGEVVAYGAPPGGGSAAALSFLCVGAQTTAAPLAPGMTEPEVLDALDQFHAKHLIVFEGVKMPGVVDAFNKYVADGKGKLHTATITGPDRPGHFTFTSPSAEFNMEGQPALENPERGHCLLLRTSGTTARPKGVPLEQQSLVNNGALIAASMQLTEKDTCYSVMPLFHIGGISGSILCTLSSGGSVCCDGAPFDPGRMVDAMATSRPQPTWYSSVPTIHNATVAFIREHAKDDPKYATYGVIDGVWEKGHSLRMIRSGAAALLAPDAALLSSTYGGMPIYPTYSMSEQMPISQPPAGKGDCITTKPGSVGVPVATSLAIVSRSHLRPQPYGQEGEIAIMGDSIMRNYLENPEADAKNYFFLTMPGDAWDATPRHSRYFLTGDVGVLDSEGFLSLKGRAKELIKKGGEQVSPYEVEAELLSHPWVRLPVCFSVPSKVYGEEVGCAIVLNDDAPPGASEGDIVKSLRKWMKEKKFAPVKWPTKWWFGPDEDLPKTKTKKYIRVGLHAKLGFGDETEITDAPSSKIVKAKIDWGVITGFRFFLAAYVMFMHIGSNESWSHFNNLRGWPYHVHCFYTLGGFSMASPMNPAIKKTFSYTMARIGNMYPMYTIALILGLINLLVVCRPSTFRTDFHWDGQPDDKTSGFFCEGVPAIKGSWWGSLVTTLLTYIIGLAVTPIWPLNWWMGYYLWFSSMYYQCLVVFPAMYNYLFLKTRRNLKLLCSLMAFCQILNAVILVVAWFAMKGQPTFNHYDPDTGEKLDASEYDNDYRSPPVVGNAVVLSFYLFAPFWALYFVIGGILAFIYDAYKPAEKHNAYIWGYIADGCTLIMLGITITVILQPVYNDPTAVRWFRPSDADFVGDTSYVNRLWDNLAGRIMCPLTTLWIFAMATGEGFTAMVFRTPFLVNTLGPNSYNCFLFHQMIGQWYYAITRPGKFWNWWQYRKGFYWFSPGPCPVFWYEYFYVVSIVVAFSYMMDNYVTGMIKGSFSWVQDKIKGDSDEDDADIDIPVVLCGLIEKMTGIEPEMDSTLDEVGLASVGIPVIVGMLNSTFSTKRNPLSISAADLVEAETIEDIAVVVETASARMQQDGV